MERSVAIILAFAS